jgi:anti-sigma factor RsiW
MNCNEVKKLLMPYYDGELANDEATAVADALADCPDCRAELAELESIHRYAADAFEAPLAAVDFSGVYDGVMARIAAEDAAEAAESAMAIDGVRVERDGSLVETQGPGLLDRISAWFGELFRMERPIAAKGFVAALAAVVAGVWLSGNAGEGVGQPGADAVAGASKDPVATPRRGAEREVMAASRYDASVQLEAVAEGKVTVLEFDQNEETPLVLWHTVDGEGVPAPDGKGL